MSFLFFFFCPPNSRTHCAVFGLALFKTNDIVARISNFYKHVLTEGPPKYFYVHARVWEDVASVIFQLQFKTCEKFSLQKLDPPQKKKVFSVFVFAKGCFFENLFQVIRVRIKHFTLVFGTKLTLELVDMRLINSYDHITNFEFSLFAFLEVHLITVFFLQNVMFGQNQV